MMVNHGKSITWITCHQVGWYTFKSYGRSMLMMMMKLSKHDETLTNLEVMSSQDIPQN